MIINRRTTYFRDKTEVSSCYTVSYMHKLHIDIQLTLLLARYAEGSRPSRFWRIIVFDVLLLLKILQERFYNTLLTLLSLQYDRFDLLDLNLNLTNQDDRAACFIEQSKKSVKKFCRILGLVI